MTKSFVYNRLFTKILDSSIWLEPDSTRIVWITLLAAMNEDGYAHFSALENLAARAHVSMAKAKKAIACFESPDPNSENLANEGRRIERVPGGYLVLNAAYYREKFSREIEKEQTRIRVARHREKVKESEGKKSKCNKSTVTESLPGVSPASASVSSSVQEEGTRGKPKDAAEVINYARSLGLPETDGHYYYNKWESNGYKNGGEKIRDWRKVIVAHKSAGYCPSQKKGIGASSFQKPKEGKPHDELMSERAWQRKFGDKP